MGPGGGGGGDRGSLHHPISSLHFFFLGGGGVNFKVTLHDRKKQILNIINYFLNCNGFHQYSYCSIL